MNYGTSQMDLMNCYDDNYFDVDSVDDADDYYYCCSDDVDNDGVVQLKDLS